MCGIVTPRLSVRTARKETEMPICKPTCTSLGKLAIAGTALVCFSILMVPMAHADGIAYYYQFTGTGDFVGTMFTIGPVDPELNIGTPVAPNDTPPLIYKGQNKGTIDIVNFVSPKQ